MEGDWSPPLHPRDRRGRFTHSHTSRLSPGEAQHAEEVENSFHGRDFGSDQDARAYADGQSHLSGPQAAAVQAYTSGGAPRTNAAFRQAGGSADVDPQLAAAYRPTTDDLTLTRVIPASEFGPALPHLAGYQVTDAAPSSTSLGNSFVPSGPGQVTMRISAPKGTPVVFAGPHSGDPNSREVLLAPGQSLAVTGVRPNAQGGYDMNLVVVDHAAAGHDHGGSGSPGPGSGGPAGEDLDHLKAQADASGPQSRAAVNYRMALDKTRTDAANHGPHSKAAADLDAHMSRASSNQGAAPTTRPQPPASPPTSRPAPAPARAGATPSAPGASARSGASQTNTPTAPLATSPTRSTADAEARNSGYQPATRTNMSDWDREWSAVGAVKNTSFFEESGPRDDRIAAMWSRQGFDGLPQVMSPDEFDALPGSHQRLYRGLNGPQAEDYAEQFHSGEAFPGLGAYGNGTYTSTEKSVADAYATGEAIDQEPSAGVTVTMALHPQAKVGTKDKIMADWNRTASPAAKNVAGNDLGKIATALGYDAFTVDSPWEGGRHFVIQNRSALIVRGN